MPERLHQLQCWLEQACGLSGFDLAPASADASFRRYFRLTLPDGVTRIAMDAPPDREDCRPFVAIAERLAAAGLHVPRIHAADIAAGFLLLEDLGSRPYLDRLNPRTAERLYGDAIAALLRMQRGVATEGLPRYDRELLMGEMALFPTWLLQRHLGLAIDAARRAMLARVFEGLTASALAQPVVCVHRDYHSRNLMEVAHANPGIIDFQDAVAGPLTYDLVSLLRDCYIAWPRQRIEGWLDRYLADARDASLLTGVDREQLHAWFDLMGVQRHLKAAGIFARLWHRDGKSGYLADLPRTLGYIVEIGQTREAVADLADFIDADVLPRLARRPIPASAAGSDAVGSCQKI